MRPIKTNGPLERIDVVKRGVFSSSILAAAELRDVANIKSAAPKHGGTAAIPGKGVFLV
jgi:hypothetical protein